MEVWPVKVHQDQGHLSEREPERIVEQASIQVERKRKRNLALKTTLIQLIQSGLVHKSTGHEIRQFPAFEHTHKQLIQLFLMVKKLPV